MDLVTVHIIGPEPPIPQSGANLFGQCRTTYLPLARDSDPLPKSYCDLRGVDNLIFRLVYYFQYYVDGLYFQRKGLNLCKIILL